MGLKRDVGLPPHLFHSALWAGNFGYLPFSFLSGGYHGYSKETSIRLMALSGLRLHGQKRKTAL